MNSDISQNFRSLMIFTAAYVVLVAAIIMLPGKIPYEMVRENGPVETFSVGGYFLFCLFIVYFNVAGILRTDIAPGFFVLLLGLRELDFHARFTTMGMFKIKFFISTEVPLAEKLVVILFIVALVAYAFFFLRGKLGRFKADLLAGSSYAFSIACALGCLVFSKFLDGNSELFEYLLRIDESSQLPRAAEECMELFIPVFLVRALLQYAEKRLCSGRSPY